MQVISSLKSRIIRLPFHSAVDIVAGSMVMKGVTAQTDLGTAIVADVAGGCAAGGANSIGILAEKHTYALQGSALVAGAVHSAVITGADGAAWFAPMGGNPQIFPSRQIEVVKNTCMCRIDYSLTGDAYTTSGVTVTPGGTGEDNIDTGFLYGVTTAGGVGQLRFIDSVNGTTNLTTAVAFTTGGTSFVKILPLLHNLFVVSIGNTITPSLISTTNAVGTARIIQLERHIVRNGADEMMDPYTHGSLNSLNSLSQLGFYGVFAIENTLFSPMA